jgi:membrane associated rhomboid family serine protease
MLSSERRALEWFKRKRPPPKWRELPRYPVIGSVMAMSVGVTIAWWSGLNIGYLLETPGISHGELWRLLTSSFPHVDILHLGFNLYWLGFWDRS